MSKIIVIKALEDGVTVLFTSKGEGINLPTERLDKGEVLVLEAPEKGDSLRIRGMAELYTPDYMVNSESGLVIGGRSDEGSTDNSS